ncbi:hypothetical protein EVAR_16008_1 [Eumeta japonica]|uniref:Uncharacterized protein n=1 Tax=Eumeta variegata TaxID=151549 RepID=A0A4C1VZU2_EUMVA|nr:hypothetical protein EVAR_16008_1 [Eumeta japonica]
MIEPNKSDPPEYSNKLRHRQTPFADVSRERELFGKNIAACRAAPRRPPGNGYGLRALVQALQSNTRVPMRQNKWGIRMGFRQYSEASPWSFNRFTNGCLHNLKKYDRGLRINGLPAKCPVRRRPSNRCAVGVRVAGGDK